MHLMHEMMVAWQRMIEGTTKKFHSPYNFMVRSWSITLCLATIVMFFISELAAWLKRSCYKNWFTLTACHLLQWTGLTAH